MKNAKRKLTGWPWIVVRPNGVDEYGVESEAREDAGEGGVVMPRAVAMAAPDLLAACAALTEWWGWLAKDTRLPNHDIALEAIRAARAALRLARGAS